MPRLRPALTAIVLLSCLMMLLATDAAAQAPAATPRFELSGSYGHMWGGHLDLDQGRLRVGTAGAWTVALDIAVAHDAWLEASYTRQETGLELDRPAERRELTDLAVGYWQLGGVKGYTRGNFMPYVLASLGVTHYTFGVETVEVDQTVYPVESATRFSMRLGVGCKAFFGRAQRVGVRAQFTVLPTLFNAGSGFWFGSGGLSIGLHGDGLWQYLVSGGVTVRFGG